MPPLTLVCIYINKRKNAFSNFLRLIYLPGRGPEGGTRKKWKMAYKSLFPSYFLKKSTLSWKKIFISFKIPYFDFSYLSLKMHLLGFNQILQIIQIAESKELKKLPLKSTLRFIKKLRGKSYRGANFQFLSFFSIFAPLVTFAP